ncbi:hypothetical protein HDU97_002798 [Phlyctochytrium planicorne]|nr:hypothetical protein HDU97_002798 [Phlyctochytrium planicorne]
MQDAPPEILHRILELLHPHHVSVISKLLRDPSLTTTLRIAVRNLEIFAKTSSGQGALGKLHWDALGPTYMAALLISYPVCPGIVRTVCKDLSFQLICDKHRLLINEAIAIALDFYNNDLSQWSSLVHPVGLRFLAIVGDQSMFSKLETLLPQYSPVFKGQLRKCLDVAILSGDWKMAEFIWHHEIVKKDLSESNFSKMVLQEAIGLGDLEQVIHILYKEEEISWNPRATILSGIKRAIMKLNSVDENSLGPSSVISTFEYLQSKGFMDGTSLSIRLCEIPDASVMRCVLKFPKIASKQERLFTLPLDTFKLVYSDSRFDKDIICSDASAAPWLQPASLQICRYILQDRKDAESSTFDKLSHQLVAKALASDQIENATSLISEFNISFADASREWITKGTPVVFSNSIQYAIQDASFDPSFLDNKLLKALSAEKDVQSIALVLRDPRLVLPQKPEDFFKIGSVEFFSQVLQDSRFDYTNKIPDILSDIFKRPSLCEGVLKEYVAYSRFDENSRQQMAFLLACAEGDMEAVRTYVIAGCDPSIFGGNALKLSSLYGQVAVTKYLCDLSSMNPQKIHSEVLLSIAASGDIEDMLWALSLTSVDPSYDRYKFPIVAVQHGHIELLRAFLDHERVSRTQAWRSAVMSLTQHKNLEILEYLGHIPVEDLPGMTLIDRNIALCQLLGHCNSFTPGLDFFKYIPEHVDAVFTLPFFSVPPGEVDRLVTKTIELGRLAVLQKLVLFLDQRGNEKAYEMASTMKASTTIQFEVLNIFLPHLKF